MWNLPGPGIKPVFPALVGRFLSPGTPGKSWSVVLNKYKSKWKFSFLLVTDHCIQECNIKAPSSDQQYTYCECSGRSQILCEIAPPGGSKLTVAETTNLPCGSINLPLFSSAARLCPILCDPIDCSTPGFPVHHQLLELTQAHVHWVGDAIQPFHPLSSPSPHAFNLFQHQGLSRVFSNESVLRMRWPKYWSFSLNISPSNECSGLISFRIGSLDLLAVQTTLKSLLQTTI